MLSYFSMLMYTCALVGFSTTVKAVPWVSPALDQWDEVNDVQIYNDIINSMKEWESRKLEKNISRRTKREEPSVCYKDLGCFEASGPFGYLDMLPGPPEEIATKFLLYPGHKSRRSGFSHAEVPSHNLTDAFTWAKQGFNKSLPTKVLIHGFGSDCTHVWVYELRSALMAVEEMNIICVDWANGAELPNYVKAATNTRLVGKQLAILLNGLIDYAGLSPRTMHLIGFSLGAHVAGFAGSELKNLSRITGLDPAGPLFESQDPRARLDQTDAEFVDVIHSNGENLILGGLGSWQPLGHVDYYPNGGRMQKGCSNIFVGAVSDIIWSSAIEGRSLCNHRRAYKFFTDSVSPRCHFPAFPCNSYEDFLEGRCFPCSEERNCGNMGYYADQSKGRGQLYLITRDEEPFCAHQYHVKVESSTSEVPITSYGKIQITLVGESDLNETFVMTRKDDEEMKLGHSISKILVPHPILADLTKIQILYTAYSGWLSSGLHHWKIDRVTLSDSFGKSSSICKKSLILQSGIPITLPLYPGHCNIPEDEGGVKEVENKVFDQNASESTDVKVPSGFTKFIPTPVIKIGNEAIKNYNKENNSQKSFQEAFDIFNIPWQPFSNDKDNRVDDEKESSRALNTRPIIKADFETSSSDKIEIEREIVEPILKPHSSKIGRSHNLNKEKHEISEPILGPTTTRSVYMPTTEFRNKKEITYNFYDSNEDDWIPSSELKQKHKSGDKWKRKDDTEVIKGFEQMKPPSPSPSPPPPPPPKQEPENDAFNFITMTVQFLPQRIARMFEQAERYARETILPFVSAHAPKIIRDFIVPEEKSKYVPLHFEEMTESIRKVEEVKVNKVPPKLEGKSIIPITPPLIPSTSTQPSTKTTTKTTPYTHIQKINKKGENIALVFPQATPLEDDFNTIVTTETNHQAMGKSFKNGKYVSTSPTKKTITKEIFVNLPVYEDLHDSPRYIPLHEDKKGKS